MRKILFKGKRKDNGECVEGYLFDDGLIDSDRMFIGSLIIEDYKGLSDDEWDITGTCFYEVIPETVGQYTGLTDKNGKKIFEGDIHRVIAKTKEVLFVVRHGKYYDWQSEQERYGWYFQNIKSGYCNSFYGRENDYANIIGNINDNPELLEASNEQI